MRCEISGFRSLRQAGARLRNRYNRIHLFALAPQLGLRFEPQLERLDQQLDDEIVDRHRNDLARRHPKSRSRGRPSTAVEVILRMLVVMRLYDWSCAQAEYFVNDCLVLRQSCRGDLEKVPNDIEIGFGCLAPTVLGPGLRLDGALGQAPTWLFDAIVPRPRAKKGASR